MTKRHYATPAMVAAALHAVLLFGVKPPPPVVVITKPEVPKTTLVQVPPELFTPPPSDPDPAKVAEVKPIRGDLPPPETPETPSPKPANFQLSSNEFRPVFTNFSNTRLPPVIGDPNGVPDGRPITADMSNLIDATKLDRMPRAKFQVAPDYPFELKRTGVEGSVLIEFDVDTTGQVVTARVLRSDHREFEGPTLRAVLKWRFEPGRRNGVAVPFRMQIPVDYHLNQN